MLVYSEEIRKDLIREMRYMSVYKRVDIRTSKDKRFPNQ